jgi:hypothetical protein
LGAGSETRTSLTSAFTRMSPPIYSPYASAYRFNARPASDRFCTARRRRSTRGASAISYASETERECKVVEREGERKGEREGEREREKDGSSTSEVARLQRRGVSGDSGVPADMGVALAAVRALRRLEPLYSELT